LTNTIGTFFFRFPIPDKMRMYSTINVDHEG
jgi:hypothetical protein